jgi:S1-C subfamily serine protease
MLSGSILTLLAAGAAAIEATASRPVIQELAEQVRPSVIELIGTVAATGDTSYGSGFVVHERGLVITNAHVVRGIENLQAHTWDGAILASVEILLIETDIDLAVLRVTGLNATPLAPSGQTLPAVGSPVVAVGHPRGYEFTVSEGIVSATRTLEDGGVTMIQMTTPISPGSSGGPLLNLQGQVVGVCSLTLTEGQNINFAIPVGALRPVIDKALTIERALRAPDPSAMPAEALALLVRKQRDAGDLQSASRLAERALQRHPQFLPLLIEAAETAFSRGAMQEVRGLLARVEAIAPNDPFAAQIKAATAAETGDCETAIALAQLAVDSQRLGSRQLAEAHAVLAECIGKLGDPAEALGHVDRALAYPEISKLPDYHALRAFLLQSLGKHEEADLAALAALSASQWDAVVQAALRERGLPRLAEVVSYKRVKDGQIEWISGVVRNRGPVPLEEIVILAEGRDARGVVLATGSVTAIPKRLVPGATGSFKLELHGSTEQFDNLDVRVIDFQEQ